MSRLGLIMKRVLAVLALAVAVIGIGATTASAGSPHFVDDQTQASVSGATGATLTVTGKEAGLGDEAQIHVVLTAEAQCVNGGGNHPKAANKESFTAAGDFPVQNGKADFSLRVIAEFDPLCSPPMTVEFTSAVVTDETNGLSLTLL